MRRLSIEGQRLPMEPEDRHRLRTELAVAFLLLLATCAMVALVGWGRIYAVAPAGPEPTDAAGKTPGPQLLPPEGAWLNFELTREEQAGLMALFLDSLAAHRSEAEPPEPSCCEDTPDAPVFVTIYPRGGPPLREQCREQNLARSVRTAARRLSGRMGPGTSAGDLRVRMDILTEGRRFPVGKRRDFAERKFGAPVGLALWKGAKEGYFLPADVVGWEASNHRDMLRAVCRRAGLRAEAWRHPAARMWLLKAESFVNDSSGSRRVLPATRGLTPGGGADVAGLLRSCRLAAEYLLATQSRDGSFTMYFAPETGLQGGCESLVLQAEAAAALARLCELAPEPAYVQGCHRALAHAIGFTQPDPAAPGRSFVSSEETCHAAWETEESAQLLAGICRFRRGTGHAETDPWIASLADFLLFMQGEGGEFELKYDPKTGGRTTPPEGFDRTVVQAKGSVALALAYRELGTARFLPAAKDAFEAALPPQGGAAPDVEFPSYSPRQARWVVSALLELSAFLPEPRYAELAARIAEQRRGKQLGAEEAPSRDLVGGTLSEWPPEAADTADDLVVFAGAAALAGKEADLRAAERAAAYLMRLQFLPENSYHLQRPERALGGFRQGPGRNLIRLPTMDSALRGLVLLTDLKFGRNSHD